MNLSDDDKKWFMEEFERLGARLGVIAANQERLFASQELLVANYERLLNIVERGAAIQEQHGIRLAQLDAKIEQVETNLLTEFHKWASPNEARQRTHTATLRAIDLEMESLSDRVKKLEDPGRTH